MAGAPARRVTLPVFLVEDGLVTDAQVRRLREKRMAGKTLAAAAAAAGMSERTARKCCRARGNDEYVQLVILIISAQASTGLIDE